MKNNFLSTGYKTMRNFKKCGLYLFEDLDIDGTIGLSLKWFLGK
jgi:hypothetical protein